MSGRTCCGENAESKDCEKGAEECRNAAHPDIGAQDYGVSVSSVGRGRDHVRNYKRGNTGRVAFSSGAGMHFPGGGSMLDADPGDYKMVS